MKNVWIVLVVLALPLAQTAAAEKTAPGKNGVKIQKVKRSGSLEDVLREMWGRLRSLAPKMASDAHATRTQVAGVRGAESTGTLIKPYWKGDRTQDPDFLKELELYNAAQQLADAGNFSGAIGGYNSFIKTYPQSRLRANAQFGLGLAYGGVGAKQKSIAALNRFVKTWPKHPLNADARQMVAALNKG